MATTIKDRTRLDSRPELVGMTVDKYEIVGVVGKGGMGRVYEAINTTINKRVAMKCIDADLAKNPEATARFQREALAASAIESPHIVQIFDAGETREGMPFIVMELLRGQDLGRCIAERGRLDLPLSLSLVAQILKGLSHAHEAGIVHRDLKPDNVFLVQRDDDPVVAKLLDFGVSKIARPDEDVPLQTLTRQGTVVGTPFYMSPEQAQAFPDVDHRTDLYSVGAILYECLTGRAPHVGRAYEQVIVNICMHDAEDVRVHEPSVPEEIATFIARALSRERDDRFQSAREMLTDLRERAPTSLATVSSGSLGLVSSPGMSLPGLSSGDFDKGLIRDSGSVPATTNDPTDTPRIVAPSSKPAHELADTVGVAADEPPDDEAPEELKESGITARSPVDTLEVKSKPMPRRRWPLAIAPGVMVLAVAVLAVRFGASNDEEAAPTAPEQAPAVAEAAPPADEPTDEPTDEPSLAEADSESDAVADNGEEEDELHAKTETKDAAKPGAVASARPKAKAAKAKSAKAKPVATSKAPAVKPVAKPSKPPKPEPTAPKPSLELQTE